MTEYWIYDRIINKRITAKSLNDARAKVMKSYGKTADELTSVKIATGKNDCSLGELRYDPFYGWKWVAIERAHKTILRYTSAYLVNKDGSLGKKLGNAYRI